MKEGLADMIARKRTERKKPHAIPEITRICQVPMAFPLTEEEIQAVNDSHVKADAPLGFSLQRVQAEALFAYSYHDALFGPIEVGGGKTAICLRIIGMEHEAGAKRTALFVPPQVIDQLVQRDIAWCRARLPLGCSFHILAGRSRTERRGVAASGLRGCYVIPYSLLSTADTSELLEMIQPELMVFDEAHNLKNKKSARTKRVLQHLRKHPAKVVAVSGTMTQKSIKDYAHLIQLCLGRNSPLPLEAQLVSEWSSVLDANPQNQEYENRHATGPLRPLVSWNNRNFPDDRQEYNRDGFRRAYQTRLLTTPGVVSSPADSLGTGLLIQNRKAKVDYSTPEGQELQKLTNNVIQKWLAPTGDEIEWAIHKFAWLYQLSSGFYYNLYWPDPEHVAKHQNCSMQDAEDRLQLARKHHAALQDYHSELKVFLSTRHIPGCDTPMLVGKEMSLHGAAKVPQNLYKLWKAAKDLEFPNMPERLSEPIRICDYKILEAIKWMRERKRGIIWFVHQEMGRWLHEVAKKKGLNSKLCLAGQESNRFLTSPEAEELTKETFLLCSVSAHGTGKNLQYMDDQLFLQFPRPEDVVQQTLGRTHRKGQKADEVTATTMISNEHDEICLAATLNDGVYNWETTGSKRKVLFANWSPMPIVYGETVLQKAGTQAKKLTVRQRKILEDKFGKTATRK